MIHSIYRTRLNIHIYTDVWGVPVSLAQACWIPVQNLYSILKRARAWNLPNEETRKVICEGLNKIDQKWLHWREVEWEKPVWFKSRRERAKK
jgi:hypothetical protein